MPEYLDQNNIRCFEPENTPDKFYIPSHGMLMLEDIQTVIAEHFGSEAARSGTISISAERIQTRCLGYDGHDPADWTDYIVLERHAGLTR